jgi:D-3-phosphoglycerate dehydrogenase
VKWRVLNAEPAGYAAEARRVLSAVADLEERAVDRRELLAAVGAVDALIVRLRHQIDGEVFDAAPRLKAIVSATTGLDHIDVERARAQGVAVLSLRGEFEFLRTIRATAEHTWALLLALVRRIPAADAAVRAGAWERDAFRGRELSGRRLRLVGFGRVGRQVAGYGLAFGMDVAAYDPVEGEPMPGVERRPSLESLLADADVISVHVPLDDSTRGLLNSARLGAPKLPAFLVNTSRGEVLDEAAAVDALRGGRLAGLAADVVSGERGGVSPLREALDEPLNIIITPHIAGATWESMARTEVFMATRLVEFIERAEPGHGVRA